MDGGGWDRAHELEAELAELAARADQAGRIILALLNDVDTLLASLHAHRTLASRAVAEGWPLHTYEIAAHALDKAHPHKGTDDASG